MGAPPPTVWVPWLRRAYTLALLTLLVISACSIQRSRAGLTISQTSDKRQGTPMLSILPQSAAAPPSILMVHGQPGSKELLLGLALSLARAGVGAHLIDLPGCGGASGPDSPEARVGAVRAAYLALVADNRRSDGRVAFLGQGVGADAAAAVAAELKPAALIVLAPLLRATPLDTGTELTLVLGERQPRELRLRSVESIQASATGPAPRPILIPRAGTMGLPLAPQAAAQVALAATRVFGVSEAVPPGEVESFASTRNRWLLFYLVCCFLLFSPAMSTLAWIKGQAPDVFLATPLRVGRQLAIAALACAAAPILLTVGVPLGFLQIAGGGVVASVFLASATLRALLLWAGRLELHMPPFRPLASSVVLGLVPFAYLYFLIGGLVSRELFALALDGPRALRAASLFVFLLPFFLLEEAALGPLVPKLGAPVAFLFGVASKVFVILALTASVLMGRADAERLLLAGSLPLLAGLLISLQMFTTLVTKSTENATMAASFGAMTLSWLLAVLFPLV